MDSSDSDPTSSSTTPSTTIDGTQGGAGNGPSYGIDGKIMLGSVVILFAAIIIVLWFHSYACWLLCCCRSGRRRHRLSSLPLHQAAAPSASALQGGLDVSVLKTLHTFTFNGASKNLDNLGNCPVCLSEFEDGEAGRALPKCGHAFHVECIDMWFRTHSNCPICRAPVQADIPAAVSSPRHGNEDGNSSSGNCPVEQVGISVEAPPSMEESHKGSPKELGSGSDGGNRAKSPGIPVLYMKKDLDHLVYMNFGAGQAGNFG